MTVKFKPVDTLPPKRGREGAYAPLFEACRKNPGQWFLVQGRKYTSLAENIKNGKIKGTRPDEFEAASRNVVKGKGDIYVRFVGAIVSEPLPRRATDNPQA